jgi:CRP-like cAMP-binding protein
MAPAPPFRRKRVAAVRPEVPGAPLAVGNRLLTSLRPSVLERIAGELHLVHLGRREFVFRAHEPLRMVHFPVSAVVSLVARLETGDTLEVGLVGRDGLAGTAVFPGITTMSCDGIVQLPGTAWRMNADTLRRELRAVEPLHAAVGRYAQVLLLRSMQMSACNMFHTVSQRCIRWLLTVNDLVQGDDIPLTHELIATMLGVRRPTVTLTLRALQRAGLVSESRGRVTIRDRRKLEQACCECYRVMADEQRRLLGY